MIPDLSLDLIIDESTVLDRMRDALDPETRRDVDEALAMEAKFISYVQRLLVMSTMGDVGECASWIRDHVEEVSMRSAMVRSMVVAFAHIEMRPIRFKVSRT